MPDAASPVERLRAAIYALRVKQKKPGALKGSRGWNTAVTAVLALPEWAGIAAPVKDSRGYTMPITREWCEQAAKAEAAAGDPDCTTGQPPAEDDRAHLLASLEVAQQKIAAGAGLLREVTAQLAAKEAKP